MTHKRVRVGPFSLRTTYGKRIPYWRIEFWTIYRELPDGRVVLLIEMHPDMRIYQPFTSFQYFLFRIRAGG